MEITDVIEEMYEENPLWRSSYRFKSVAEDAKDRFGNLYNMSEFVDKTDRVLGSVEALMKAAGPGIGYVSYTLLRGGEELFLKMPFAAYYAVKTKDLTTIAIWAGNEMLASILPFGTLINIYPLYKKRTKEYIKRYIRKRV